MFTRKELFNYFEDDYTDQQVTQALRAIARFDPSVDPEGQNFEDEITEQLEGAFEVGEKVLSQDLTLSQATNAAVEMAARDYPNLDSRIFGELLYIVSERAIARAVALHQVENAVFDSASAQLDAESLEKARDRNERQIKAFQLIGNNDERINKILEEYGVNPQQQTQEWIKAYERVLEDDDEDFDPTAYLTELKAVTGEEPAPEKKSLSKSQSRKLVRHLFTNVREAG